MVAKRRAPPYLNYAILLILILIISALFFLKNKGRFYASGGPNIILISIETTRADHLGCYGYQRNTSPTMDSLAREGALFTNMFAQRAETWPSLASIMTSLYPADHKVRGFRQLLSLSPLLVSLPQVLRKNRYICGAFLTNAAEVDWRGFNYKKGVENDEVATEEAIGWLKKNSGRKKFLWLHYFRPHNYSPPNPFDKVFSPQDNGAMNIGKPQFKKIFDDKIELGKADLGYIVSLYDGCILFVDSQINRLLTTLQEINEKDNSLVVITADHGEELYRNYYFGHSFSIYDGALHIPFIIRYPPAVPKNIKIEDIVESIDIAPTILELAKIPIPKQFKGRSLVELMSLGNKRKDLLYAYSEWDNKISIRTPRYRYIFTMNENKAIPGLPDGEELYDITLDPQAEKNIASAYPEVTRKLRKKLFEWDNFDRWVLSRKSIKKEFIPKQLKERLRSLGYL